MIQQGESQRCPIVKLVRANKVQNYLDPDNRRETIFVFNSKYNVLEIS